MRVYKPRRLAGYELCHPVDRDDYERIIVLLDGVPRLDTWRRIEMEIVREDEKGTGFEESDSPWLGPHALFLRRAAIEALEPLLSQHGELLPLVCNQAEIHAYNPWVIDAFDEQASLLTRYKDGQIMSIEKYVFHDEAIRGVHLFKIPNRRASPTFVSQEVVHRWQEAGLRGLGFDEVWASP